MDIVMFVKVNMKVKVIVPCGTTKVQVVAVAVASIGLVAGACAGTRDARDTTHTAITRATNAALTVDCLLKAALGIISA